jgi:hypothetical protein
VDGNAGRLGRQAATWPRGLAEMYRPGALSVVPLGLFLRRPQEAKVATQRGFPVAQTGGGKRRWLQLGVWRRAAARRRRRAEPRGVARRIGARRPALERCCLQIRLGTFNQKTENQTEVSVFRFLGSVSVLSYFGDRLRLRFQPQKEPRNR